MGAGLEVHQSTARASDLRQPRAQSDKRKLAHGSDGPTVPTILGMEDVTFPYDF